MLGAVGASAYCSRRKVESMSAVSSPLVTRATIT
jgi:hypothetical protein